MDSFRIAGVIAAVAWVSGAILISPHGLLDWTLYLTLGALGALLIFAVVGSALDALRKWLRDRRRTRVLRRRLEAMGLRSTAERPNQTTIVRWGMPLPSGGEMSVEAYIDDAPVIIWRAPLSTEIEATVGLLPEDRREVPRAVREAREDEGLKRACAAFTGRLRLGATQRLVLDIERDRLRSTVSLPDDTAFAEVPDALQSEGVALIACVDAVTAGPLAEVRRCPCCDPRWARPLLPFHGDERVLRCPDGTHGLTIDGRRAASVHRALGDLAKLRERLRPHEEPRPCPFCHSQMSAEGPRAELLLCEGCGAVSAPEGYLAQLTGMPLEHAFADPYDSVDWVPLATPARAARPAGTPPTVTRPPSRPAPRRVGTTRRPGAAVRLFATGATIAIALFVRAWYDPADANWGLLVGALLVGALPLRFAFVSDGVRIEREPRRWTRWWGVSLLFLGSLPLLRRHHPVDGFDRVTCREDEVTLDGRSREERVVVASGLGPAALRRIAEQVARCLDLDLVDDVRGGATRAAGELHLSALERMLAQGEVPTPPDGDPPEGLTVLPEVDGRLSWEIALGSSYRYWPHFLYFFAFGWIALGATLARGGAVADRFVGAAVIAIQIVYLGLLLRFGVRPAVVTLDAEHLTLRQSELGWPWSRRVPLAEVEELFYRGGLFAVTDRRVLRLDRHLEEPGARWLARELLYRWWTLTRPPS